MKHKMKHKKDSMPLDEFQALWQLFRRTSHAIAKARERELNDYGVSGDAVSVLFTVLMLGQDAIPAKIAKHLLLEPHSVSHLLSRMQEDGLVTKVKDLERKNYVRIELTDKGLDLYTQCTRSESTSTIMSKLTKKERTQLWSVLAKLRDVAIAQLGVRRPILYPPSDREVFLHQYVED